MKCDDWCVWLFTLTTIYFEKQNKLENAQMVKTFTDLEQKKLEGLLKQAIAAKKVHVV